MSESQYDSKRLRIARIEALLQTKPMTKAEIAEATGYSRGSVWHCMDVLIDRKRVYVASWDVAGTRQVERFSFGDMPNAIKPVWQKQEDDEEIEIKRAPVVVKVQRDPLVAALFGAVA